MNRYLPSFLCSSDFSSSCVCGSGHAARRLAASSEVGLGVRDPIPRGLGGPGGRLRCALTLYNYLIILLLMNTVFFWASHCICKRMYLKKQINKKKFKYNIIARFMKENSFPDRVFFSLKILSDFSIA